MKKQNNVGVEESLATRNEIHQKFDAVSNERQKAARILRDKKGELDTATRSLEDFKKIIADKQYSLSGIRSFETALNPKFDERRLTAEESSEYAYRQDRVSSVSAELAEAQKHLDALVNEEKAILAELYATGDSLAEILHFQKKLDVAKVKIDGIQTAINNQNSIVEKAASAITAIDGLSKIREDVLAAIAVGEAKESALADVDRQIAAEAEKGSGFEGGAKSAMEMAQQTIAGLERKLAAAQDELAVLEDQKKAILTRFLMSEAEKVGLEYSHLAKQLVDRFEQLTALENIITEAGSPSIVDATAYHFIIPRFLVRAHDENSAEWFFDGINIFSAIDSMGMTDAALEAEKKRITGLGVSI